ncbi:MAG: hypothetical protein L6Q54_11255 [Leptospiraceae bacterium]|nr:methyl-accepting chemotaxis protein [Leptospiraceae bacterium]MCK6381806.1 hypothetical protein [Leptospiraceae bacterium]NUM42577.1 methyl-accepting chemotaxis protein [Leptospiraceae bacterium]
MQKQTRWKYYIDKEFQNHFIFGFSGILIINALLTIGIVWLVKSNPYSLLPEGASVLVQVDAEKAVGLSKQPDGKYAIDDAGTPFFPLKSGADGRPLHQYNAFDIYLTPVILISLLNILVIIAYSLFFSHRMAGPVHRIKMSLEDYVAGKQVGYIKLRKNDHFSELADLLNKALKLEEKKKNG